MRGTAPGFEPGASRSYHSEVEPVGTGPARAGILLLFPLSYAAESVQSFLPPSIKEKVAGGGLACRVFSLALRANGQLLLGKLLDGGFDAAQVVLVRKVVPGDEQVAGCGRPFRGSPESARPDGGLADGQVLYRPRVGTIRLVWDGLGDCAAKATTAL